MPHVNEEVQREVEESMERTGTQLCIWQIEVIHMVLEGKDVIMIAATGSGKSLPYWMPLLYIKSGIVIISSSIIDILE